MSDFEKILVTAIAGVLAGLLGYQLRRMVERREARRAQIDLFDLLDAFGEQIHETGGDDFSGQVGVWYYAELAEMLSDIAKAEHRALGGKASFLLMRLIGGLRLAAGRPEEAQAKGYEIDEIIDGATTLKIALAEMRYKDQPATRRRVLDRLEFRRRVMRLGHVRAEPSDWKPAFPLPGQS